MPVMALLVILPLIEIALFTTLGAWLGLWSTLAIVLASAVLGVSVIQKNSATSLMALRTAMQERRDPGADMAHGALTFLAGVLLIIPGFLTDAAGLLLLIPAVRRVVMSQAGKRFGKGSVMFFSQSGFSQQTDTPPQEPGNGDTIDGDFIEIDPSKRPTHRPSGWTRH